MTRKVAIVGAGIGAQHLDAFLRLKDRFEVAVICDLDQDRAHGLADPHGIATEANLAAVMGDPSIEIIDICLPPHLHLNAGLDAMDAGKHVICEKPLVTSLADADRLAEKARTAGRRVFPVFQYRFGQGMAQLRKLIDTGFAGRCFAGSLETHWNRGADYYAIGWRGTWKGEQGGALLGHAIHIHDLLTAILGPVARVYAETGTRVNKIEVEDCAALSLRMDSGALITSSVTLGAADNSSRIRLNFEGFTVESDHAAYAPAAMPWKFVARAPTTQAEIDAALSDAPKVAAGYEGLFSAVADDLDGKASRAVTFDDGRRSLELVAAAYYSARTNLPVELPLGPSHPLYKGWLPD